MGVWIAGSAAVLGVNQLHERLPWLRFGASPLTVKPTRFRAFGVCSYRSRWARYARAVTVRL